MNKNKLQDKRAILHLFAGLMSQPERISQKEFKLDSNDFPEPFHQIIFAAINNLHLLGAEKVTPVDIEGHLSEYSAEYAMFNSNNGLDYLFKLQEIGEPDNFLYYFNRVKKFSFLRECRKVGIDISDIYDSNVVDLTDEKQQNDRFNEMTLTQMVRHVELKMIEIKEQFVHEQAFNGSHMSDNVKEIMNSKKLSPSYGYPFASKYLNTIFRGSRKKKFILKHANTGTGKSRMGFANMAVKCIPVIWDIKLNHWVNTGANGSGLVISTELDEEEVKLPFLAYIACIDESKIHDNELTKEEEQRFDEAIKILEASNLRFEELQDFDIEDIETLIQKNINKYDVEWIEFDYIHTSLKLLTSLAEQGVKNLREDQVLLIMGITLKNMCNKYNIFIESSTQLNDNQNINDNMDQSWIRGSKALADKIDGGYIMLPMREKDMKVVEAVMSAHTQNTFGMTPNISLNVYKSRGTRFKLIRVWGFFDMGTLRFYDLFCTNYKGELVDVPLKDIVMEIEEAPVTQPEQDSLPDSFNISPTIPEKFAF